MPGFFAGLLAGGAIVALAFLFLFPKQDTAVVVPDATPVEQPATDAKPAELPPLPPEKRPASEEVSAPAEKTAGEKEPGPESSGSGGSAERESSFTNLRGRVVYGDNREPLPGILVKFSHERKFYGQCLTDESGGFSHGLSRPGEWTVMALPFGSEGYRPSSKVTAGASGEVFTELHVPDRLEFQVSGRVTDEEQRGLDGVNVSLHCYQFGSRADTNALPTETTTSGGGNYVLSGISLRLLKPKPRKPQSVDDDRFGWSRMESFRSRQHINLSFHHPDYGSHSEDLSRRRQEGGVYVVNVALHRSGVIHGFVVVPGGESVDGHSLSYRLQKGSGYTGSSAQIKEGRFSIKVNSAGTLVVYGQVGKYRVVPLTVGRVDTTTVKEGVRVELAMMEPIRIPLVDQHGNPLDMGDEHLWVEVEGDPEVVAELDSQSEWVEGSALVLPCRPKKPCTLELRGSGIVTKTVALSPDRIPDRIVIERLKPIMKGVIRLPPDVEGSDLSVTMESQSGNSSSTTSGGGPDVYDEETGAFEIFRDEEDDEGTL
ncbi:MAG: hypothetical protein ACYS47_18605, partial [Planctomycetota bacterium]